MPRFLINHVRSGCVPRDIVCLAGEAKLLDGLSKLKGKFIWAVSHLQIMIKVRSSFYFLFNHRSRAGFVDSPRTPCLQGPHTCFSVCFCHFEILNNIWTRDSTFSFCPEFHKFHSQVCREEPLEVQAKRILILKWCLISNLFLKWWDWLQNLYHSLSGLATYYTNKALLIPVWGNTKQELWM